MNIKHGYELVEMRKTVIRFLGTFYPEIEAHSEQAAAEFTRPS